MYTYSMITKQCKTCDINFSCYPSHKRQYCSKECTYKPRKGIFAKWKKTHGMTKTKFYKTWERIKYVCNVHTSGCYYKYGSKGIKVCKHWNKFENFQDDMYESYLEHTKEFGEKNTQIDRIDCTKDYKPSNCRWVTLVEQANNKRNTRYVTYKGETKSISDWAREVGIKRSNLYRRIFDYKWDLDRAMTKPETIRNR